MAFRVPNKISINELIIGIKAGNRLLLSKAITLIESKKPEDQPFAVELIDQIILHKTNSLRLGITGVPGVGKSTFIEAFGLYAISKGKKVAVLTVDPSSTVSKGSILGDKTRMNLLSQHEQAFIRPTPSGTISGGVASKTRESMLLCEAAGFDLIIVETVGVGQSEVMVKDMVDYFQVLMLTGAGDELQGIKRGIMELADGIAINKADGDNLKNALVAKKSLESTLHYFPPHPCGWTVPVSVCSSLENTGMDEIWEKINVHHSQMLKNGWFADNRKKQTLHWMRELIESRRSEDFYQQPQIKKLLSELEQSVNEGKTSVRSAVNKVFKN